MTPKEIHSEERVFSLGNLSDLCRKQKKRIFQVAILSAGLAFGIALLRPIEYEIEASFKESTEQKSGEPFSAALWKIGLTIEADPQASALMKSYQVLKPLVQDMGLQVEVKQGGILSRVVRALSNRFRAEWNSPLLPRDEIRIREVSFEGEKPQTLELRLSPDRIGEKICMGDSSFRIAHIPNHVKPGTLVQITLHSWVKTAIQIRKQLQIKADKTNKSIYHLSLRSPDRFLGKEILNGVMAGYQAYLKREHDQIVKEQLAYLGERQEHLRRELDQCLGEQMSYFAKNGGLLGFEKESQLLSGPYSDMHQRAFAADLELADGSDSNQSELCLAIQHLEQERNLIQTSLLPLEQELMASRVDEEVLMKECPFPFDLETAKQLLIQASGELDRARARKGRYAHFATELEKNSSFELSCLLSLLDDPASKSFLERASQLELQLKDEENHSAKEQERASRELSFQRKILLNHLREMIAVEDLNAHLYEEKNLSLQRMCLDDLNRQIAVGREQIAEGIRKRKEKLTREKNILEGKMQDLRDKMSRTLPEKWRLEQMFDVKTAIGMKTMESVTQLVEGKTIGSHLHHIESKPLDYALAPELALRPHLLLFPMVGAIAGAFFTILWTFLLALYRGFPVLPETLRALRYPFSGSLSCHVDGPEVEHLQDEDLETLRKLILEIDPKTRFLVLFGNTGPDYSHSLAHLLEQSGRKVLLTRSDFAAKFSLKDTPGLLQLLRGQITHPPIRIERGYQFLPCGGYTRYGAELLRSSCFQELMHEWKNIYDCTLLFSRAPLDSAECKALLQMCDQAFATLALEPIESLTPLIEWAYHEGRCRLSFLHSK
jgi:hypothetical protein